MGRYRSLILSLTVVFYFLLVAVWVVITDLFIINLIVTALTIILTITSVFLEWEFIKKFSTSYFFRFHVNTMVRAFCLLASLALINFMMFKHPWTYDFSKNGVSSLSSQTISVLKQLNGPIKMTVFSTSAKRQKIVSLLELYRYQKGNVSIEYIDPTLNPGMVKSFNITEDGTVVFEYDNRREKSVVESELTITNALIRLSRENEISVCWSKGHGELDLSNSQVTGGSFIKDLILKSSYKLIPVEIAKEGLAKGCHVLVILDPKSGFLDREVRAIQSYLKARGKMVIGLGPDINGTVLSNLREMLTDYGLTLNNDFVVDRTSFVAGTSGLVPLIRNLSKESIITKKMKGNIFFPLVSSIDHYESKIKGKVDVLAQTTGYPSSWAEKNLQEMLTQKVTFNDGVDMKGPIHVAVSWDSSDLQKDRTKIIIVGNGAFLQNKYQKFVDNFTFFMNSLAWLSDEDQLQSFTDILLEKKNIVISSTLKSVLFYFSLFFAPMFFVSIAIFVYQRRMKL